MFRINTGKNRFYLVAQRDNLSCVFRKIAIEKLVDIVENIFLFCRYYFVAQLVGYKNKKIKIKEFLFSIKLFGILIENCSEKNMINNIECDTNCAIDI